MVEVLTEIGQYFLNLLKSSPEVQALNLSDQQMELLAGGVQKSVMDPAYKMNMFPPFDSVEKVLLELSDEQRHFVINELLGGVNAQAGVITDNGNFDQTDVARVTGQLNYWNMPEDQRRQHDFIEERSSLIERIEITAQNIINYPNGIYTNDANEALGIQPGNFGNFFTAALRADGSLSYLWEREGSDSALSFIGRAFSPGPTPGLTATLSDHGLFIADTFPSESYLNKLSPEGVKFFNQFSNEDRLLVSNSLLNALDNLENSLTTERPAGSPYALILQDLRSEITYFGSDNDERAKLKADALNINFEGIAPPSEGTGVVTPPTQGVGR